LKFTSEGFVELELRLLDLEEGMFLEAKVKDTGSGIKAEDIGKLFKLFGFLQSSKQQNTKGIGLGLAIAK
jgi:signal transduction histidine kinase